MGVYGREITVFFGGFSHSGVGIRVSDLGGCRD